MLRLPTLRTICALFPKSLAVRRRPRGLRCLSTLMDTTDFSETQLTVREAIGKICARFPDVPPRTPATHGQDLTGCIRSIGQSAMRRDSTRMSSMRPWRRMGGLGCACPRGWEGRG
jgi:hypothetical protein